MKKTLLILLILFAVGCGKKVNICNVKTSNFEQNWEYVSEKGKIKNIELDIIYDSSIFGVERLNELNQTEKVVIKKEILSNLGFEKDNYNGLKIDIIIANDIKVKIKADLEKADKKLLNQIGIDFDNTDIDLIIDEMTEKGASCK